MLRSPMSCLPDSKAHLDSRITGNDLRGKVQKKIDNSRLLRRLYIVTRLQELNVIATLERILRFRLTFLASSFACFAPDEHLHASDR
jgi:hypothetical protein